MYVTLLLEVSTTEMCLLYSDKWLNYQNIIEKIYANINVNKLLISIELHRKKTH